MTLALLDESTSFRLWNATRMHQVMWRWGHREERAEPDIQSTRQRYGQPPWHGQRKDQAHQADGRHYTRHQFTEYDCHFSSRPGSIIALGLTKGLDHILASIKHASRGHSSELPHLLRICFTKKDGIDRDILPQGGLLHLLQTYPATYHRSSQ